jgi:hypothetical protein
VIDINSALVVDVTLRVQQQGQLEWYRKVWECTARRRRKQAKKGRVEAVGRDSVGL